MNENRTVDLKYPITYLRDKFDGGGETTLEQIELPRVKARHLRAMDLAKGDVAKTLALLQAVTGLPKAAIDELDGEDVEQIGKVLAGPLARSQETGTTSSE